MRHNHEPLLEIVLSFVEAFGVTCRLGLWVNPAGGETRRTGLFKPAYAGLCTHHLGEHVTQRCAALGMVNPRFQEEVCPILEFGGKACLESFGYETG